ncbi:MAG TPA: HAD-IA family hydrolase, partial [Myxococcota bacterium]
RDDIDGVVFDLDGTLIDSEKAICAAASLAFADVGLVVDEAAVADHLGAPLVELFDHFAAAAATFVSVIDAAHVEQRAHFISRYIAHYDLHPDKDPPALPGVVAALDRLRALGVPFAVATTKPTRMAVQHLTAIGLLDRFAAVCGTDPPLLPKPAPDVVLLACSRLGVDPRRAVMVGDTSRDVGAARAAGCLAVVVAYGIHRLQVATTLQADVVVSDLRALFTDA